MKRNEFRKALFCVIIASLLSGCGGNTRKYKPTLIPKITGDWWQLTTYQPDIDPYEYEAGDNQVCDFTIFQAKDNTWQLIACVRGNNYPGSHRFLYRWQAENITEVLWEEQGVFKSTGTGIEPDGFGNIWDSTVYPKQGLLQAPHCVVYEDNYYLFYNNSDAMCMRSTDGRQWIDLVNDEGKRHFFEMGRDVMILDDTKQSGKWIAYYTSGNSFPQYMEARTSESLTGNWSEGKKIYDGWSNTRNPIYRNEFAESPFVLYYDQHYYLFAQMHVFISNDPLNFTDNNKVANLESCNYDERMWAPEIILDNEGQYYIAAYRPKGIFMARLEFIEKAPDD